MTTSVKAHFDGKVFVPDEAVAMPVGAHVQLHVELSVEDTEAERRAQARRKIVETCRRMNGGVGPRTWTRDDLYER